ncbi:MAG: hypothetical protein AAFN92_00710 [Bacteroidota bacterium]
MNSDQPGFLDEKLGEQQAPLPPELRWEAMEDRLAPRKKKRRFFWLWWLSGAVSLLLFAGWWSLAEKAATPPPANPLVEQNIPTPEPLPIPHQSRETIADTKTSVPDTGAKIYPQTGTRNSAPAQKKASPATITDPLTSVRRQVAVAPLNFPSFVCVSISVPPVPGEELTVTTPNIPRTTRSPGWISLGGGATITRNLNDRTQGLPSSFWRVATGRSIGRRGWALTADLTTQQLVWKNQVTFSEDATLFRPGTVDTIFRNLTTGAERIVTTDSVAGTRTTAFRGYGKVQLVGLQLGVSKAWPIGRQRISTYLGIGPALVVDRSGRFGNAEAGIRPLSTGDNFPLDLWWTTEAGLDYRHRIAPDWQLGLGLSLHTTLGRNFTDVGRRSNIPWFSGGLHLIKTFP